ncbi:hypothetical protein [Flavobacterium sp. N2038]|uniref:hypothetical protein n=1 Tax=Flavobacterium sp. N2038 TaxID=2986829 RepID=UPI0022244317|nr:hypothetical protein [Flavobacterium sp. N2038]
MKKIASLILFALLLNGCDDGDLTIETVDFSEITATSCDPVANTLIYKLKPQESLLLQMPENSLKNNPTNKDTLTYNIDNTSFRVFFRAYDGVISKSTICDAIPPASPKVSDEWYATGGQIRIATKAVYKDPPPEDGHTEIVGYNHNIIFRGITFSKPGPKLTNDELVFGDYQTTVTPAVVVAFTDEVAKFCDVQLKVYNNNSSNSLVIENLDKELIKNENTPPGTPRTSLINLNGTTNNVFYRMYNSNIPEPVKDYYCTNLTPTSPTVKETWVGVAGVQNVSGIIEVTTTSSLKVFKHKVVLRNVTLKKENSTFKLATEFVLGTVTTIAP